MKFISWNVNGLRAIVRKNFQAVFEELDADWFCIQETKLQADQLELDLPDYYQYYNYAERKGYSGTAIFTKHQPLHVTNGLGVPALDHEGRIITLEYSDFFVVTCYTPNSQTKLKRIAFREQWDQAFNEYVSTLAAKKPVIMCGDFNVAHHEIDLKHPEHHQGDAGFSEPERADFSALLANDFIDTFRTLHPETVTYSWWDYRHFARKSNAGWRIDYFIASSSLQPQITAAAIHTEIMGSDHCPIELDIKNEFA
ncbi:exodeoxyribonuclease III [Lactobacillus selangorensis]|uniref:Exodeoxyribonuclease III n=1 Tax=Lactobacillus selangorensis TaxID=81857 RepID=A0A0R2FPG2_9LACO|nr:exodeoxyribonuclease III [Lactobacillus selangorensis]KRN27664.1 exodeoxyribonuclease III [Lactobacillus selangorensis]KRN30369.1 exodeoxyribonuclease III [Lactobacillus selangorensis]